MRFGRRGIFRCEISTRRIIIASTSCAVLTMSGMAQRKMEATAAQTPSSNREHAKASNKDRSKTYKRQSLELLKYTFRRISVKAIRTAFEHYMFAFIPTFKVLSSIQTLFDHSNEEEPFLQAVLGTAPFLESVDRIIIKNNRDVKRRPRITDNTLIQELDTIPEMNEKENYPETINILDDDDYNNDAPKAKELDVECGCCYGDFAFEDLCQCMDGHLFCPDCIRMHVEEQLFGLNMSEFKCMSMDCCNAVYPHAVLKRALPEKLLRTVDEHLFRANVEKADIADLL